LAQAASILAEAGVEEPRREARLMLGYATGLDMAGLLRCLTMEIEAPWYDHMVERRAAREPLAFILGRKAFWNFEVAVTPETLIPRPDSETLIEAAVWAFPQRTVRRVLDLGTGSGCLLFAALIEFPEATGVGVDRSEGAAAMAQYNAAMLGLAERTHFVCCDWGAALDAEFDLVLSNPPYIETAVIERLMPEVAWYEPLSALDGGANGLRAYHSVIAALPALLAPGGVAILELGAGQLDAVSALAEAAGLKPDPPRQDLSGVERALPLRPGRKKTVGEARRGR
jgi:release factor glutamine methyltransferase